MKKYLFIMLTLFFIGNSLLYAQSYSLSSRDQSIELRIGGMYLDPKSDDDWKSASGADMALIFWGGNNFGMGLSVGTQEWKAKDYDYGLYTDYYGGYIGIASYASGKATIIPIGLSMYIQHEVSDVITGEFELGVKYQHVNSKIEEEVYNEILDPDGYLYANQYVRTDDVDIKSGITMNIGYNLHFKLNEKSRLAAGVGYQFDTSKGDWGDLDYQNSLEAVTAKICLAFDI